MYEKIVFENTIAFNATKEELICKLIEKSF